LVYGLRHQDGGSHIGPLTDPAYRRLKAGAGLLAHAGWDSPVQSVPQGVSATMRQVAWEITETLKQLGDVT
jgi:hypothetical protein